MINVELIIVGVLLGGTYAAISLGLSLVFGVLKLINMAHGYFALLSAYLAYAFLTHLSVDPFMVLPLSALLLFGVGYVLQRKALNYLTKISPDLFLIATFGIAALLENLFMLIFTPLSRALITPYSIGSINLGGVNIPQSYLIGLIGGTLMVIFLQLLLDKTFVGLAIKACSQDKVAATLMGLNPDSLYAFTMGLATSLAAVAGILMGLIFPFTPTTGTTFLIISFGAIVIGGLGSMLGTFVGGIVLGLAQVMGGSYFGVGWSLFVGFILILGFLLVRPKGLFGR